MISSSSNLDYFRASEYVKAERVDQQGLALTIPAFSGQRRIYLPSTGPFSSTESGTAAVERYPSVSVDRFRARALRAPCSVLECGGKRNPVP